MESTPLSHWIGFHIYIFVLLGAELIYARRRTGTAHLPLDEAAAEQKTHRTSVVASILWVTAAVAFALFILRTAGSTSAGQYLAGYAIEESLSIDNLFVFLILFRLFQIVPSRQPRVLFWGVAGAILMRGAFVAAGIGLLAHFHWISYLFAGILFIAAVRLLFPQKPAEQQSVPGWLKWISQIHPVSPRQDCFFVRENGRTMATILFLCLLAIEVTDIVFALDSIPAVLSITQRPFIAYTSNIMAVMGLRSLYFLLAHMLVHLRYLHYGLATVLAFAALKMVSATWLEIGPALSLAIIVGTLAITIVMSVLRPLRPS